MLNNQKVTELLSQKFNSNICIYGSFPKSKYTSILDVNNGTNFITSDNLVYSFKDNERHRWFTVVHSFHANGKEYFPSIGDHYTLENGIQYSFTTKDEIVEMAVAYFSKHVSIS
ncbi:MULTISPECIES: hypothetical protein [Flavobacterium]|uniref:hypothetical protein n=1 Tax=Flavobacterium TaxID=237 RepID=UPI002114ACA7|nr:MULTISPECIES: hypothetical protein [Flavobacterium]UUF13766.1 hypothetical protein NLJ00_21130 [Flavobacterium panici]